MLADELNLVELARWYVEVGVLRQVGRRRDHSDDVQLVVYRQ